MSTVLKFFISSMLLTLSLSAFAIDVQSGRGSVFLTDEQGTCCNGKFHCYQQSACYLNGNACKLKSGGSQVNKRGPRKNRFVNKKPVIKP